LFAARFGKVEGVVVGAHDNFLLGVAALEKVGGVDGEGRVSAFVFAGWFAVDPDLCSVVDCTEVDEQPFAFGKAWSCEPPAVPDAPVEAGVVDAARFRFGAKGTVICWSNAT
jgi:hypothetical protein